MFKYSKRRLRNIADNYEEYSPALTPSDKVWTTRRWTGLIEEKTDFDRALMELNAMEVRLVQNPYATDLWARDRALRKMRNYLNGVVRDENAYRYIRV